MGPGDGSDEYEETAAARWEAAWQEPHAPPPNLLPDPVKPAELTPSYQQHAAEARERSPGAPTGDERSTAWAMRFRAEVGPFASLGVDLPARSGLDKVLGDRDKYSSLPGGKGILQTNVGAMVLWVDIMDRTTGAVGSYTLAGAKVSWGASLPYGLDGEISTGQWKPFNTTEMSLKDFDKDWVRIATAPFNLFKTLQFTSADVEYKDTWDSILYGDGVDINDLGQGVPTPELSWGGGRFFLQELRWEPIDPWGGGFDPSADRLDNKVFKEAFEQGVQEFVQVMATSQLLPEAVTRTAHKIEESLDQKSSPDPVSERQHEIAGEDAQQSLPTLPDPGMPDAGISRLPDDAPTDFSDEQAFRDYSEQRTNLPPEVDPLEALDHSVREQQAQQSLPTEKQLADVQGPPSTLAPENVSYPEPENVSYPEPDSPPAPPPPSGGSSPPSTPAPGGGGSPPSTLAPENVSYPEPENVSYPEPDSPPATPPPSGGSSPPSTPAPGGGGSPPSTPAPAGGWDPPSTRNEIRSTAGTP